MQHVVVRLVVGGVVGSGLWFFGREGAAAVVAGLVIASVALRLIAPRVDAAIARALARGIGGTLAWVLLTLVFALFIVPFGLLARRGRRDRLARRIDRDARSYFVRREAPSRLDRPY